MSDINKVTVCGRLGTDPEFRTFPNGKEVMNLNMATSDKWKDKQTGEWKEDTQWHRISIFDSWKIGKMRHLRKGDQVYVEGKIVYRSWETQDGTKKYVTEIKVNQFDECRIIQPWPKDTDTVTPDYMRSGNGKPTSIDEEVNRLASEYRNRKSDPPAPLDDDIPF